MTTKPPPAVRASKTRWVVAAAALSLAVHGGLLGSPIASTLSSLFSHRDAPERPRVLESAHLADRSAEVARPVILAAERRELVERARADRAAGRLALGAFILATNDLDAREQRQPFDLARARLLYAARLEKLRAALAHAPARRAAPEVFGDLHYVGRPGGRMGDALLDGGGSCEPLSHLLAAAMFDSGHPEGALLRYYGGDSGGATHLAPVVLEKTRDIRRTLTREYDLLTGGAALEAGVRFPASDLVEAYARAHGLAAPLAEVSARVAGAGSGAAAEEKKEEEKEKDPPAPPPSSLFAGYPPNRDRYPGAVPLYASHAVQAVREAGAPPPVEPTEQAADCAFFVRMAVLDRPTLGLEIPGRAAEGFAVEIHRMPTSDQIDRTFSMIRAVEQVSGGPKADVTDRLMGLACLAALYDRAAVDLTLVSERALGAVAAEKRAKAAAEGEALLAHMDWAGREGAQVLAGLTERFSGRNWLLLVLPGGDAPVLRLVGRHDKEDWGRINALAALAVDPGTRARALDLLEALPQGEQVDVMHEVFHAHDHLRPWASNYALDDASGALSEREFSRAYRVFRGLAWGLWEGSRAPDEVLSRMVVEARRERLGRAWEVIFLEYYGRNALNLHASRPDAEPHARGLRRWLEEHGYTDLELYRIRLAEI